MSQLNFDFEEVRKVHAMPSDQARSKKLMGHNREILFNSLFGDKNCKINYSGQSSDCQITNEKLLLDLKEKLKIKGNRVSLKSGDTIQIHLGWEEELTDRAYWISHLSKTSKGETTSDHGIEFNTQKQILKTKEYWNKYLGKQSDILCYFDQNEDWIFFNMDDVTEFVSKSFDWRLLPTGRIKGDYKEKQLLTYEYRPESHKKTFVLGAHGGKKGKEFINLLISKLPFVKVKKKFN